MRKKQIFAGMFEVCLGMSVVCPGMSGYARLYLYPWSVLVRKKQILAGMPEVFLCLSGYVWVCPGSFEPPRRFSAQKHISTGMPELCLGMSVVCPGMPGCICIPGTF